MAKIALAASEESVKILLQKAIIAVVNPIITLFFIMAICVFAYGIFEFIQGVDNPEARTTGQKHMMYGIVGFFIMIAVFAIIKVLMNTIGVNDSNTNIWVIK